ncbi:Dps family protein [Enterococcus faecalis]|uniref:Dps family protein n=1 Tax=Enterococcus faecalis TaxID=1351 RepID=UPI002FBDC4E7
MKYDKTKVILNQLVADLSIFSVRIHQVHWYMSGAGFLMMHPKMDELMDQVNSQLDEVSERLITLDGNPYSTLDEFIKESKLCEKKGSRDISIEEYVDYLLQGYQYLVSLYGKGITIAGEESDTCTEDIFIGHKKELEKLVWMLKSELRK